MAVASGASPALGVVALTSHTPQRAAWDCGLACLSMALQGSGKPFSRLQDLHSLVRTSNVWTIDLAYLLRMFQVDDFTMYTSYIGINVQNAGKAFYRDSLSSDRARIHALFANAKDRQIRIAPLILDLDDARRFLLSSRYAIVMLVNLALLNCKSCKKERQRNTILRPWWWLLRRKYFGRKLPPVDEKYSLIDPLMRRSSLDSVASSLSLKSSDTATAPTSVPSIMACVTAISASPVGAVTSQTSIRSPPSSSSSYFAPSSPSPLVTQTKKKNSSVCSFLTCCYPRSSTPTQDEFTGHYILLVGYDLDTDTFYYRDPGTTTSLCSVRGKSLERARNSPGTDHDAIVIKMR